MNFQYKVILINLDKDRDRLNFMENQLHKLGIKFDRFSAIHGKNHLMNNFKIYNPQLSIEKFGRELTAGEFGCALSHNICYKNFLEKEEYKDTKYLLILEDDIILDKDFKNILEREIDKNENKPKWDYLQFNYYDIYKISLIFSLFIKKFKWNYVIFSKTKNLKLKVINFFKIFISPFFSLFTDIRMYFLSKKGGIYKPFPKNLVLTGAYIIKKEIAIDLYNINKNIIYSADIVTSVEICKYKKYKFGFYTSLIAKKREEILSSIDSMGKR